MPDSQNCNYQKSFLGSSDTKMYMFLSPGWLIKENCYENYVITVYYGYIDFIPGYGTAFDMDLI